MRTVGDSWTSFFSGALDFLYPRKCPLCGLLADLSPCESCWDEFVPSDPRMTTDDLAALNYRVTLYRYTGRAGQAVRLLKYRRSTSLTQRMTGEIADAVAGLSASVDAVVPVPIHWSRRCSRGFNQSELLCEGVAHRTDLLRRVRRTKPQAGLRREERERNLIGAFWASPEVAGKSILLVDDVLTTGHTARECAKALRQAGAAEVGILAFCGDA
jgi:ComF family protein